MPLHLRVSTNRRGDKTYQYHQLVRAVRVNGRPTQQVVAHLGLLSEEEVLALREGLESLKRKGENSTPEVPVQLGNIVGVSALRYLDLKVVRSMWEEWSLGDFFRRHLPDGMHEVAPAEVVFALVANRCVAPCSKLRVTEWVPTTCLPQLLGFNAHQLNNTRIHRVLDALEGIEGSLSQFLITHPVRTQRPDSVVFLDVTSTWFEGHGGTLGQRSRTKDGAIRRHVVQLALGVDARGLPLQWELLPGKMAEVKVLPRWIESLGQNPSLRELPLVFDRGLTSEENFVELISKDRKFITCARESQVEKWDLSVDLDSLARLPAAAKVGRKRLLGAGLKRTSDNDIYHVDQGVRIPPGMKSLTKPGLRVVPYFRPSLFFRNRDSLERVCRNVEGKVKTINAELRVAKANRSESVLRKKITNLLRAFQIPEEYSVAIEPLEVLVKDKRVHSFQVHLTRLEKPSSRRLNAGWMVLLAHPDDDRPALDLIRQYHQKEAVEHAFAIIKSFIDLRPVHHHTDRKIKAHVTLCVLALLLNRHLELRLREAGIQDAIDRVYEALEPCRLQVLSVGQDRGAVQRMVITRPLERQLQLLRALGLTHLANQTQADALAA